MLNLFGKKTPAKRCQNLLKAIKVELTVAKIHNEVRVKNDVVSLELSNALPCIERAIVELEGK